MATVTKGRFGVVLAAEDYSLGDASGHSVSRFRLHVTAVAGTVTVKQRILGDTAATAIASSCVTTVGSTTTGSTITATGLYDVDATGMETILSSGTSCTFSWMPVEG
jgi:hypothetical protein